MPSQSPDGTLSFLTPYWSGSEMMRLHVESIRDFHPGAPILVSKRGGPGEMASLRERFGVRYWIEECAYIDAFLRLLERCETEYACVLDHDVILLAGVDALVADLAAGRCDVVGVDERIRAPAATAGQLPYLFRGWMRFAPGCMASNFILFNWREFRSKWGLRGVLGTRRGRGKDREFDYGIGQRLTRHKYLQPYHLPKYGLGNLLLDGTRRIAWHQWYGSYRTRLVPGAAYPDRSMMYEEVARGEQALLADYPDLDFSGLVPAWGPERDVRQDVRAFEDEQSVSARKFAARAVRTVKRWNEYGLRGIVARCMAWAVRWWRLR